MDFLPFVRRVLAPSSPRWMFHLVLVPPALGLLYGWSFPGIHFLIGMVSCYLVAAAAVIWALRLVGFVRSRPLGKAGGRALWFAAAPLAATLVATLLWVDAPLRARWALSRSAFQNAAVQVSREQPPSDVSTAFERRLGLYSVSSVWRVETGVIFYETTGALLDDAGFAYLPAGPTPDLENGSFEDPHFHSLGGGWYAWTASW